MSSNEEFNQLELEFAAFLKRPTALRNFTELRDLLQRIFPPTPVPAGGPSGPPNYVSTVLSRTHKTPEWLPKSSFMSSHKNHAGPAPNAGHNESQPQPPAHSYTAYQPEHQPQQVQAQALNVAPAHPNSGAGHVSREVPFLDHSAPHPVLPPLSSILQPPLGQPTPTTTAAAHNPTAAPGIRPTFLTFAQPVVPPRAPFAYPYAPQTQPGLPYLSATAHARTGSIISSYSNAGSERSHAETLTSSVASGVSSDAVRTPDTSSAGRQQGMPWQPAHTVSVSSGQSLSSAPAPDDPKIPLGAETAPAPPRLEPAPSVSAPTHSESQPRETAPPPPPAPCQLPEWAAPPSSTTSAPNPDPDPDADEEANDDAPWTHTNVTRAGGAPYVSEADRALSPRNWRMYEDGHIVEWFLRPDTTGVRLGRLQQALHPPNGRSHPSSRRVFQDLAESEQYFNNTRTAGVIYERFLRLRDYLIDIQRYSNYFTIQFENVSDETELLQTIHHNIGHLATQGVRIRIHPWRLLVFVRSSWYHWLRVSPIAELPAAQTTTTYHSGNISPVSAPSRLPGPSRNPAQPPATSRRATQLSTPSQAPPPSVGSSNGSRGRGRGGSSMQPPPPPASGNRSGPGSRNPSVSSLRAPREPSSGRLARNNVSGSTGGPAGPRPPRLTHSTRSVASGSAPIGPTPSQSEAGSAVSRATNSPADVSTSANAEFVRSTDRHYATMADLREREVNQHISASQATTEQNDRLNRLTMRIMEQTYELTLQESSQRMQFDAQRMQFDMQRAQHDAQRMQIEIDRMHLEVERLALAHVAAQMSLSSGPQPGALLDSAYSSPPPSSSQSFSSPLPLPPPPAQNFSALMNQARSHVAQAMGYPIPPAPPSHYVPAAHYAPLPRVQAGEAGPSNFQFRGFAPSHSSSDDRFEDMGTVIGTPRVAATMGDGADVESMDLRDDERHDERHGEQRDEPCGKGKGPAFPRNK